MDDVNTQTAVITGGTSGIGYYSAMGLARSGFRVIITGRDPKRGKAAEENLIHETKRSAIKFIRGDISSIAAIDTLSEAVLQQTTKIDVVVNNAGHFGDVFEKTDDDLEKHFAINVLAPYRLTHNLLSALGASDQGRVINVTGGDKPAPVDPDDLQAEKGFKGLMTYKHSKSILESVSIVLARELESKGISVNIVFPGRAYTPMTKSLSLKSLPGPMKIMFPFLKLFFREDHGKSASKAAQSTIWAATSADLDNVSGKYFDTYCQNQEVHKTALDPKVQGRIMKLIESSLR